MKKMSIEMLLTWAFTEELCKVEPAGSGLPGPLMAAGSLAEYVEYGAAIDRSPNAYGVVPICVYEGDPHPSALLVGDAVRDLVNRDGFEVGSGWNPFPDWTDPEGLVRREVDRTIADLGVRSDRMNGRHVVNLVISCAILKSGPDWRAKEPRTMVITGDKGRPLWFVQRSAKDRTGKTYHFEDNGYDPVKRRPMKGAFRKWRLEYPVRAVILNRLDWQLWQSALEALYESLSRRPEFNDLVEFRPDRHPWKRAKIASRGSLKH